MTEFRKLTESSNVHLPMPELTLNSIEKLLKEERRLLAECETELSTSVDEAEKLSLALETITGVSSECDVEDRRRLHLVEAVRRRGRGREGAPGHSRARARHHSPAP